MKLKQTFRKTIALVSTLALINAGCPRCLAAPDPALITADALLVRPVSLVGTIFGSLVFVISLPVSVPSKSVHRTARALVVKPAHATFKRPLGDFDDWGNDSEKLGEDSH